MDCYGKSPFAEASSHRYPGWVMLDPYVCLNSPAINYPETYAEAETSMGEHISVSFRAVPPPKVSRLYVNWNPSGRDKGVTDESELDEGDSSAMEAYMVEPKVVAAHGNSILFEVTVDTSKERCADFFLYTAHRTERPSLRRLPECGYKLYTEGFSIGINHMFSHEDIGILCRDDKEVIVADLQSIPGKQFYDQVFKSPDLQFYDKETPTPLEVQLCIYGSPDWYITQPRIHWIHHVEGRGDELFRWSNDAVVPCGDSLYYVDYLRGILFANVLSEFPEQLHYIRLPVEIPTGQGNRDCPEMYRRLCVTNGGIMKFVDVDVCTTVFASGRRSSSFTINLWKLIRDANDNMKWEKESALRDCELRSLEGYNNDLQHSVPKLPLVSMEEPNTIFFVLNNHHLKNSDPWIIMVDMLNKTLLSSLKYTTVGYSFAYDGDMVSKNLLFNHPFIPCEFSKYLQVPETRKRIRG